MRVVTISTDKKILEPESTVAARMVLHAALWEYSTIIVCTTGHFAPVQLAPNVRVLPTNSASKLLYGLHIVRLGLHCGRDASVITAQDPFEVGLAGVLLASFLRKPLQVQVHTDFLSPHFYKHSLVNRVRVWIARLVLPRASRARVVSLRIQRSLAAHYKTLPPIDVLPVFVDIEHVQSTKPSDALHERFVRFAKKVLIVARLEPEKNVMLAIDAFAKAAPTDTCLIVVGDGSEREMLQKRSQEKGITDRVFFEGWQDPAPYYHLADLLLVPSVYEGYGMVITEAHAAGLAVLATDVGIARESGAMIAEPDTFAEALKSWFAGNLKEGEVQHYPYPTKKEYMRAYTECLRNL